MTAPATCTRHPSAQTRLRCSRCEAPFCDRCLVDTPAGWRCRECARGPRTAANTVPWYRCGLSIVAALAVSVVAGTIGAHLGFLALFLGAPIGGMIGEVAFRAAGRRSSPALAALTVACLVLGVLALPMLAGSPGFIPRIGHTLMNPGLWLYLLTALPSAYSRLR